MKIRTVASTFLAAGLAWGCGAPDQNAWETDIAAAPSGDHSASGVASSPSATVQIVPDSTQSSAAGSAATTAMAPTPSPRITPTVRILALGDSMTAGDEQDPTRFRSYRGRLFELLTAEGYAVDFVGTQKLTPAIGGDPDHDGYGGAWIGPGGSTNNLTDKLASILAAVDADIIILALGWNSVYNEPSVAGVAYRDFVNRVAAAKPDAHIVVATLSPQKGQTEAQSAADLPGYAAINSVARSLAMASANDRLHLADYASAGFQEAEYWDVIHWLQTGADRAAKVLHQSLVNGPLKR
jgi:lysophospholipase L1-like esterase